MTKLWTTPIYSLKSTVGSSVVIDVTTSVSPGLPASKVIRERVVPFFRKRDIQSVLDFGAGGLRQSLPLLDAGMEVCAVEFEAGFRHQSTSEALALARTYPNFCELLWPADFRADSRSWDAALLCYVLQTMPIPDERKAALKLIHKKLKADAYLVYMSRYNQLPQTTGAAQRVSDGYFMWPERRVHSFYREWGTDETHEFMKKAKFRRIRSFSERGTDQMFLYAKGDGCWI